MPPARRKSGNTAASTRNAAAQSTLSFNSKSARVTKPSAGDASTEKVTSKVSEPVLAEALEHVQSENAEPEPEVVEVPIRQQPVKPVVVKDEAEEDKRKTPRGNCSTRPTI